MRIFSFQGLALVFTMAGFLPSIMAQDGTEGIEILSINRQAEDQRSQAEMELQAARLELARCAQQEANAKINAAAQDSQNKAQAMQGLVSGLAPSVGNVADQVMNVGNSEKAAAKQTIAQIAEEIRKNSVACPTLRIDSATGVTAEVTTACNAKTCSGAGGLFETTTDTIDHGKASKTSVSSCTRQFREYLSDINARLSSAKRDLAGASDLTSELMKAALTAGVSAMGANLGIKAGKTQTKAQLQVAALDRKSCEMNAKNSIQNINRRLAQIESLRNQDLLNASLQAAARKQKPIGTNVAVDSNAPVEGGPAGSGSAGASDATLASGGPAQAPPEGQAPPAGGAAGSGGGGGGGASASEAPWGFGNGKGGDMAGGGGLPPQPDAATFGDSGSGGGGGGGFGGFGMGDEQFAGAGNEEGQEPGFEGESGETVLGDGGISVLMNRMRARLAAHAGDLVQSIDLKQMAKSSPEPERRKPTSEVQSISLDRL
jgi:hypothetical protein